jgi:hypothetical protein
VPHLLQHGASVFRLYSKEPWFSLLNVVLLAKEQSLSILNVLGLTRLARAAWGQTHYLPNAKREHYHKATATGQHFLKQETFVKHLWPLLPWTYIIGCTSMYYGHEWKLQIIGTFWSPKIITLSKMLYRSQNITWSRYSYDKSAYLIPFQYVQPVQRKWMETSNYRTFFEVQGS